MGGALLGRQKGLKFCMRIQPQNKGMACVVGILTI